MMVAQSSAILVESKGPVSLLCRPVSQGLLAKVSSGVHHRRRSRDTTRGQGLHASTLALGAQK